MLLFIGLFEINSVIIFSRRTFIIGFKRRPISFAKLTNFPSFLHFSNVYLWYDFGARLIEEKCELVELHLRPLIPALNDSKMILIRAAIRKHPKDFSDYSTLLDHIRNRLLPICDSARCYKFDIVFPLDANTTTATANVISSVLQMQPIMRCSNVEIRFLYCGRQIQNQLPVEAILYWLETSNNEAGMGISIKSRKEKLLQVQMWGIQNSVEMIDHLKMVYFILKYFQ